MSRRVLNSTSDGQYYLFNGNERSAQTHGGKNEANRQSPSFQSQRRQGGERSYTDKGVAGLIRVRLERDAPYG